MYQRFENETEEELLLRLGQIRTDDGLTWNEFANVMNKLTNNNYTESKWRKAYQSYNKIYEANKDKLVSEEYLEELSKREQSLYKQQVKTQDAHREFRKDLRSEARIETLIEALREDEVKFDVHLNPYQGRVDGRNEAIIAIGDWHLGAFVDNFYNHYDVVEACKRIDKLKNDVISYCNMLNVKTLHVVNLGDMIEGNIHVTTRIQNEIDVIEQVKLASRLIYDFLVKLNENIETVTYRSVLDNHSRVTANFKEHIEKESFCKLIDWWLADKLEYYNNISDCGQIQFITDNINENIGHFQIQGKNVFFVHGHLGNQNTITQDLTFGTGIVADITIMGHWHEDKVKNFQTKKVYYNGTLKGVDDYALSKCLFSKPTQTLLVCDNKNVIGVPILCE